MKKGSKRLLMEVEVPAGLGLAKLVQVKLVFWVAERNRNEESSCDFIVKDEYQ